MPTCLHYMALSIAKRIHLYICLFERNISHWNRIFRNCVRYFVLSFEYIEKSSFFGDTIGVILCQRLTHPERKHASLGKCTINYNCINNVFELWVDRRDWSDYMRWCVDIIQNLNEKIKIKKCICKTASRLYQRFRQNSQ